MSSETWVLILTAVVWLVGIGVATYIMVRLGLHNDFEDLWIPAMVWPAALALGVLWAVVCGPYMLGKTLAMRSRDE